MAHVQEANGSIGKPNFPLVGNFEPFWTRDESFAQLFTFSFDASFNASQRVSEFLRFLSVQGRVEKDLIVNGEGEKSFIVKKKIFLSFF